MGMTMWRFHLAIWLSLISSFIIRSSEAGKGFRGKVCGFDKTPTLIHSLPTGRPVYGVQPIGDEIYVIRDSTPYIEVYDRNTFQPKGNITVDGMSGPYDMVQSSEEPVSLFIVDWFNGNNITTVQVPQGTVVNEFATQENGFTTLALAGSNPYTNGDIVVTASASRKIRKLDLAGNLNGEITIQDIQSPRQSIQVGPDRYAVCHGYGPPPELHRVCLINASGSNTKCYGGTRGSAAGLLNVPSRLELGMKGCILVGDMGNKRVVLLTGNLDYVRNLIDTGLDGPYRLYLDWENNLLFVADNQVSADGIAIAGCVRIYKVAN